ncbi:MULTISPECIES: hypothetical protein [Chelativorans]|jgi:hypothetical protein|uniref:hypothetical protein n=1 Tax=Chelativorans TaxID=449972 RepID=UPI00003A367A|nr:MULTISPECIES: hypothetical protein [Chelativorans]
MSDVRRLVELGMVPPLAKEVATQIDAAGGDPITPPAPIATADATDAATTQALVNECKAKINEIIAAL